MVLAPAVGSDAGDGGDGSEELSALAQNAKFRSNLVSALSTTLGIGSNTIRIDSVTPQSDGTLKVDYEIAYVDAVSAAQATLSLSSAAQGVATSGNGNDLSVNFASSVVTNLQTALAADPPDIPGLDSGLINFPADAVKPLVAGVASMPTPVDATITGKLTACFSLPWGGCAPAAQLDANSWFRAGMCVALRNVSTTATGCVVTGV